MASLRPPKRSVQRQAARIHVSPRRFSVATGCSAALLTTKKLLDGNANILRDLSQ
jgi:hypothetical protein